MSEEQLFSRIDVAEILEVSPDFVRRNETILGLDEGRVIVGPREVRYRRWVVERMAAKIGIEPRES